MDFKDYFQNKSLKKIPNTGIHYEQKTTPDLLWCVSLTILDVTKDDRELIFSDKDDIRPSSTFNSLMQDYFSKPPQEKAEGEYNKVSSYQLGLLTNAGILKQVENRPKKFQIVNLEILKFISTNDLNASRFLSAYTNKFLQDNDLIEVFNQYKNSPSQENHIHAKEAYWEWAKENTAIRGANRKHTYRVFNKIFNVFCYSNKIPGEDSSNITIGPCPYSFLIYNRDNFRDKDTPSGMTRNEYKDEVLSDIDKTGVVATLLQKAKNSVRRKYEDSEIQSPGLGYIPHSGVHIHHILPQSSFPEFSLSRENLIALTPGQHLSFAHRQGNTRTIDPKFQAICLLTKLEHIQASSNNKEEFYDYSEFISIINVLYESELELDTSFSLLTEILNNKITQLED